jgi:acyl-CoA thioester hydrolase
VRKSRRASAFRFFKLQEKVENPVAWREMDAFQHVNNIVYFDWLKLIEFMNETGSGPILALVQCKFKIPLT